MNQLVIKTLLCLLVIGSAATGPIMLTWSGTKKCENESCEKVKKDTLIAGIIMTLLLTTSIASALAAR